MKKFLFLALSILSCSAYPQGTVLLRHQDTVITDTALRAAVEEWLPPDKRSVFYASEKRIRDLLAKQFIQYKLAKAARQLELTPEEQARLDHTTRRALAQIQINRIVAAAEPEDFTEEAREYYAANREKFTRPEQVRVEHILISSKSRTDAEALERTEMVKSLVETSDKSFAELADEYSDDPSVSNNHGDLGFFVRGKMVKPFEEAAFALQAPGDVASPVKTGFGYHVIKLLEHQDSQPKPFDAVRDAIVEELKAKHRSKVVNAEFSRLAELEGIEVDQEAINALIFRPNFPGRRSPPDAGAD